eukprot:1664826-Prymnesium_polylepis.1
MARRGIHEDKQLRQTLGRSDDALSRMGTAELRRLHEQGDAAGAHALFSNLIQAGRADDYKLGVMLRHCSSSGAQRALLHRAEWAGLSPSLHACTLLLKQLRVEGREDEARGLRDEMEQQGLEPDVRVRDVFDLPEEALSRMRTSALQRLIKSGDRAKAQALFDGLVARGLDDRYQQSVMLRPQERSGPPAQRRRKSPRMHHALRS